MEEDHHLVAGLLEQFERVLNGITDEPDAVGVLRCGPCRSSPDLHSCGLGDASDLARRATLGEPHTWRSRTLMEW